MLPREQDVDVEQVGHGKSASAARISPADTMRPAAAAL